MSSPFASEAMAAGYAYSRPPVHPRVIDQVRPHLPKAIHRALDVGCGAGLSTKPLLSLATHCIGLEPVAAMLRLARSVAPGADFVAASAEAIPLPSHTADLLAAAGSLNYVNLDRFFPEAARLLTSRGMLLVYDFSPGQFANGAGWFTLFHSRYPVPRDEAQMLNPDILHRCASGFQLRASQNFEIPLTLAPAAYVEYMLTETNVTSAIRRGVAREDIRLWCEETLAPLWQGREQEVVFPGYFACLTVL